MSGFVRSKRVTDPLNEKVKAQLFGNQFSYVSSGSEHSPTADHDDNYSPSLSELVLDFLEQESQTQSLGYDSDSDGVDSVEDFTDKIDDILKATANENVDSYRNLLQTHVLKAVQVFSCFQQQKGLFRRKVMAFLRELGYNVAICKTKWNSSGGGLNGGNYEFIDVVQSNLFTSQTRYFIDVDFAAEFAIARPTNTYARLLESLPRIFVGDSEELKRIVKITCDAAKKSLKSKELSLPPWRKNRYMQTKWFGPCKRTINPIPVSSLTPVIPSIGNGVKCRRVGFENGVDGIMLVRTR